MYLLIYLPTFNTFDIILEQEAQGVKSKYIKMYQGKTKEILFEQLFTELQRLTFVETFKIVKVDK